MITTTALLRAASLTRWRSGRPAIRRRSPDWRRGRASRRAVVAARESRAPVLDQSAVRRSQRCTDPMQGVSPPLCARTIAHQESRGGIRPESRAATDSQGLGEVAVNHLAWVRGTGLVLPVQGRFCVAIRNRESLSATYACWATSRMSRKRLRCVNGPLEEGVLRGRRGVDRPRFIGCRRWPDDQFPGPSNHQRMKRTAPAKTHQGPWTTNFHATSPRPDRAAKKSMLIPSL
jgi:hypothetical protein